MQKEGEVKYCPVAKELFEKYYQNNLDVFKKNLPLLLQYDPDAIHDIRVASRRIRALIKEYRKFIPRKISNNISSEMKTITRYLGIRRELDVINQLFLTIINENPEIVNQQASSSFIEHLEKLREEEKKNCELSADIIKKYIEHNPDKTCLEFPQEFCIYPYAKKRIYKNLKNMEENSDLFKVIISPEDERIHKFRILLKKIRYMMEIYNHIYQPILLPLIENIKTIQTILGEYNDYRMLLVRIRQFPEQRDTFSNLETLLNKSILKNINTVKNNIKQTLNYKKIRTIKKQIRETLDSHSCDKE